MIKFENAQVAGFEPAIRGMRNPKNSWNKMDSIFPYTCDDVKDDCVGCPHFIDNSTDCNKCDNCIGNGIPFIGPNDYNLMMKLWKAGTDHRKYLRMIIVWVDITAPLYWWKEFDTYKVGTVANSCSTMHKLGEKEFTLDDFSCEHLMSTSEQIVPYASNVLFLTDFKIQLEQIIESLNNARELYLETKDKNFWRQMIQLLPSSYNQKRTVMMSYEMLANAYKSREYHKLDEWKRHEQKDYYGFCDWVEDELPYSEFITGKF